MGVHSGRAAYGDIYSIPTSAIDNIAARIYREQQQRQLEKRQQDKALDDEFGKNVLGIKSVDVPEVTKAYNDFKQAHIALQKKGARATPQDQMDVMIKKANAFTEIAASKEDKDYWAMRSKDGKNNKRYNPNYQTIISEGLNTPTKKRNRDLDDDRLLAKYAMPDIGKEILNATGKAQDFDVFVGADDKDPLKDKYETVKKINPPNTFYNTLYTGLGTRADNENFTRFVLDNTTDEEKNKLRTQFEVRVQDPRFKALYGEVQPFPASAANTELGQAVALKTMEAFVNLPIVGEEKKVLNADRNKVATQKFAQEQQARGFAQQKLMEGIRQANRKELFGLQQDAKAAGDEAYGLWIDNYIGKTVEDAKASGKTQEYKFADGRKVNGYPIEVDPVMKKALGFDDKNPGQLMVTTDGKFIPMFFKTDNNYNPIGKNGKYEVEPTKTAILSQDAIKLALGGKTGVKQLNKEMTTPSKTGGGSKPTKTISPAKLKSLVGTSGYEGYTEKELQDYYRKNGYEIK